jgi:GNAT superfamily N-acetyltransferase
LREALTIDGVIRRLWVHEVPDYREHLLRLDPSSRRDRFGTSVSDGFIRDFSGSTNLLDAIVHGFFAGGVMRGAAELRPLGPGAREAEAAFSLEHAYQGYGIGSTLLGRTILAARNRGFLTLHLQCLPSNRRMQDVARKHQAQLSFDTDATLAEIDSGTATPASLWREFVAEAEALTGQVFDMQQRMLRLG